jgi:tetratricopeptide (TPR) repeat protein
VLSWSVQHLSAGAAAGFSLLGLHPGRNLDVFALAALTGSTLGEACQIADELVRAHLVQESGSRLTMHDLLRAYSAEMASRHIDADRASTALTRLLKHYQHTAALATATLFGDLYDEIPAPEPLATATPSIRTSEQALSWLDSERSNLVAMSTYAATHGDRGHCVDLSRLLFWYLDIYAHYPEALAVHGNAVRASETDSSERATGLTYLGVALFRLGRLSDSIQRLDEALAISRAHGDRDGEARIRANLGLVCQRLGRYDEASDHLARALTHYRGRGDTWRGAKQLLSLGLLNLRRGHHPEAADHLQQAAVGARAARDQALLGLVLANLGDTYATMQRFDEALDHLAQALAISRELGQRRLEGDTLRILGSVYRQLHRDADAVEHLHEALAISRETGDRRLEIDTHNTLGETVLNLGRASDAVAHHKTAHDLADGTGDRLEQARALDGLAVAFFNRGDNERARRYGHRALAIYTELDMPAAGRVRERLGLDAAEANG